MCIRDSSIPIYPYSAYDAIRPEYYTKSRPLFTIRRHDRYNPPDAQMRRESLTVSQSVKSV